MIFCEPPPPNFLRRSSIYNTCHQPWSSTFGGFSPPASADALDRPSFLNLTSASTLFSSIINTSPTSPTSPSSKFLPTSTAFWSNKVTEPEELYKAKTFGLTNLTTPTLTAINNSNYLNALTDKVAERMEQKIQEATNAGLSNYSDNGSSMARVNSQNAMQSYNPSTKHDPSILASPMASRRDFGALLRHPGNSNPPILVPQSHSQITQNAFAYSHAPLPPAGTKMLIDPNTGQQYFVPTAQPQMTYYSVYYANAPAPNPQPIFYQQVPAPGYYYGHQIATSPSHQTASQPMFFTNHSETSTNLQHQSHPYASSPPNHQQQSSNYISNFNSNSAYRVEIPPSSVNSNISPNYFQRNHESRISVESSATSSHSNNSKNRHSDDSMSPPIHSNPNSARNTSDNTNALFVDSSRHTQQKNRNFNSQNLNNNRYNSSTTTSTSSTSGFISGSIVIN